MATHVSPASAARRPGAGAVIVKACLVRLPHATVLSDDVVQGLVGQPVYAEPGSARVIGTVKRAWTERRGCLEVWAELDIEPGLLARVGLASIASGPVA